MLNEKPTERGLPCETEPISPSETKDWLTCPTYWRLSRDWEPNTPWTPHISVGIALGEGLNKLLGGKPFEEAQEALLSQLGALYVPNDEWSLEALITLSVRGLKQAQKTTVKDILEHETVIGIETSIGNGRIDLLTKRDPYLIITDHKSTMQLDSRWVEKRLLEAETDWQLWDYTWRVVQFYQHDPNLIIRRRHLLRLSPVVKCYTQEFNTKEEVLSKWADGAEAVWYEINRAKTDPGVPLPMRLSECVGRYGRCKMYEACHDLNQDPALLTGLYRRKEHGYQPQ